MIKGRVKLDFCDALTGKVKDRIEGDNAFTNAIDSLLNKCPCGADRMTLDGTMQTSEPQLDFTKTALGGVLLFPDEVTAGANTFYEPLSHQPTAYARYDGQDVTDMKTGFYSGESGPITNGFQFVYEWGAAYGLANNGYIKTVCLTNKYGGEAYGKKTYFGDKWTLSVGGALNKPNRCLGWCDDYFYYLPEDNNEFNKNHTIRRIKRPLYEMFINQLELLTANSELVYTNGSTSDFDGSRVGLDESGKKIYIIYGAANSDKTLAVLDLTTFNPLNPYTPSTATTSTLSTTSGIVQALFTCYIMIVKRGDYLYFVKSYSSGAGVIYKINLNNNADHADISFSTGTASGDLVLMTDTNEINGTGFIIGTDDTVYETTGSGSNMVMNRRGVWQEFRRIGSTGLGTHLMSYQINPYYMATKFVLSERKQKTAALTMKLIYEVTHV